MMKSPKIRKLTAALTAVLLIIAVLSGCTLQPKDRRLPVKVLILPKFELDEMLWGAESDDHVASEGSMESVDIFKTAMEDCFAAGKVLTDAILEGTL